MSAMWVANEAEKKAMAGYLRMTEEQRKASARRREAARRQKTSTRGSDIDQAWMERLLSAAETCPLCDVVLSTEAGKRDSKHVDHVIPLVLGGRHVRSNVRVICAACNVSRPRDGRDVVGQLALDQVGAVLIR